jgi:hemimethylated DNA binding protein
MKQFRRQVARELLRHSDFYDNEFRPMANSLSKPAFDACHIITSARLRSLLSPYCTMPPLRELLRHPEADEKSAVDALKSIQHIRSRLAFTDYNSLSAVPYSLSVGDVVQHSQFGHIGVIAARLPVCFETDDWVLENLGSLEDRRMQHPWYLVLVSQHMGLPPHFVRFGSQLTHVRMQTPTSIGFHQMLPTFFKGYDHLSGRYVPRFDSDALQDLSATAVGGCKLPNAVRRMDGPGCKLPKKLRTAAADK